MTSDAKPNVKQAVPFFSVSNIKASVRFYVDGLGFEMIHKWEPEGTLRWCWLQCGDAALMLQEFRKEGRNSWMPEGKVGEGVSIVFHVRRCPEDLSQNPASGYRGIESLCRKRNVGCFIERPGMDLVSALKAIQMCQKALNFQKI